MADRLFCCRIANSIERFNTISKALHSIFTGESIRKLPGRLIGRLPVTARHRAIIESEVLQKLQSVLAQDPTIRVSAFQGEFEIDARSDLFRRIWATGQYETELAQRCIQLVDPHKDAIDVGANVGFFTVLLAKLITSGKVLSLEPMPNCIRRLQSNIHRNNVGEKVILFQGGASSKEGSTEINTVVGREEYSSLGAMFMAPS